MPITDQILDQLLANCKSTEDLMVEQGLLSQFPNSSPKCDTLQFKRLASFLQKPWLAA